MKRFLLLLSIVVFSVAALLAQTPQKMTYQAVVRNSGNVLITNHNVSVRISILQGSESGTPVYVENHSTTTNANGLMTVVIGGGNVVSGSFEHINWANSPYFLKSEIDPDGGISYSITSVQQLMSVPYALFAQEAANGFTGDYNDLTNIPNFANVATSGDYNDLTNKPTIPSYQVLSISNDTLYLTNGGFVKLPASFDGDYNHLTNKPTLFSGNYNDLTNKPTIPTYQVLSISNDTLYLTNGGFVKLPANFDGDYNHLTNKPTLFSGNYNDLTNKPTLFDGNYNNLTNKPNLFSGNYNDLTNRPQIPTVPTNVSAFTNDAGYITMDSIPSMPTIPTNVSAFTNDAGYLTSFQESQILTISHDTIYLTGGSFVKLPTAEGFSGSWNDLTDKPNIPTVPTNVSAFNNDAGYITKDSIPTNVSAFTNDAGYLTSFQESQILTISHDTIYLTGGSFVKLPTAEGFSGSYNDLTDKPQIPTVPTNVSAFTNDAGYITMDSIPAIPTVPTNVSAFQNDAGYLTSFTEQQVLTISNDTIYLTGGSFVKLPTSEGFSGSYNDLTDKPNLFSGDYNDLTNRPQIPTVPTNVSAFTNDAGYITMDSIPAIPTVPTNVSAFQNDAGYLTSFTEQQVLTISNDTIYLTGGSFVKLPTAEGFSGSWNDLTDKPNIPTVPTNVSAFNNDAGYITKDSIPTNVSAFTNDAGYLTSFQESQILTISHDTIYLTGGSFVKLPTAEGFSGSYNDLTDKPQIPTVPTNVSAFTNDAGYITSFTEQQVLTISNDTIYLTGGSFVKLPTAEGFSGSYNDLTDKPQIPTVPTNVSAFTNDAGYITMDSIPAIPTVPTNVSAFQNDAGYLTSFTEQQVLTISHDTIYLTGGSFVKLPTAEGFSGSYNDLTDKPNLFSGDYNDLTNRPQIPQNVSAFTNDAGYITMDSIPSMPTIPTNVSAFQNDAGYLTSFTEQQVLTISNDTIYLTGGSFVKLPTAEGFSGSYNDLTDKPSIPTVPTNVSAFQNDAGYLTSFTEQQILTISNDTIYLTGGSFVKLPTAEGFSGSYNDLTDKPTLFSGDYNDLTNKPTFTESQILTISHDTIYLTGGSFVKLPTAEGFSGSWNDLTDKPTLFSGDYNDLTNKPTVPTDVSAFNNDAGYLTSFQESQILTISYDTIYLTGGSFVKLPTAEGFSGDYNDLTNKPTIPTVPTDVSAFNNDAGYLTSFQESQILTISHDTIYLTGGSFVKLPTAEGFSGDYNDLTNKPTIPTVPTDVSAFNNDAGYLTSFQESQILTISHDTIYLTGGSFVKLPTGFSGSWNDLTDKPTLFSGDYNDLTNKPTIPTDVSAFNNDAGYITKDSIPTNVSAFQNDAGYLTADSLNDFQNALNDLEQELGLNANFVCGTSTVTDYDGNVYNTVEIGRQCWLKENLRSTHFANGTAITDASSTLEFSDTIPYYYNYTASGIALEQRGLLYNWPAAMRGANSPEGAQGICPTGWHVPTEAEWEQLTLYLSSQNEYICGYTPSQIAKALADYTGWQSSFVSCTVGNAPHNNNASGFSAVPAGYYYSGLSDAGNNTYIWLSTESNYGPYSFYLYYDSPFVQLYSDEKTSGNSVRCIKNSSLINTIMNSIPTVNDGTLTIQQNGNTVGTFSANQSSDQTVNITVPSANDGTLTIQQNGNTVGTFTANQSSDQTVNITTLTAENVQAMINSSLGALQQQMQADANFACGTSTVMDYDGNEYNTLRIGGQCWLKENLRSTHYANGTAIAAGTEPSTTVPYRYAPGNDANTVAEYGYLYNWLAAMNGANDSNANSNRVQGICPNNWHVPSPEEWMQLDNYLKSQSQYICGLNTDNIAKSLASTTGWTNSAIDCTVGNTPEDNNATGFSALPACFYANNGSYGIMGHWAYFWNSANMISHPDYGGCYILTCSESTTIQININKNWGLSVRCVRDNSEVSLAEQMQQQMNSLVAQQQQQIGSMQQNIDNLQHQVDSLQQVIDDGQQQIDSLQQVIDDAQQVSGGLPVVIITDTWHGDLVNNPTMYGRITSNGITNSRPNEFIVAKGFVFSSSNQNPTLQNSSFVTVDTNSSDFFSTLNIYTNTTYYVRAFATNINGTGYSDPVTVRRGNYYAIPPTGSKDLLISSTSDTIYIYTYGGPDRNYGKNFNGSLTLYPSSSSKAVRIVSGTYDTESSWDYLTVYSGSSTSGSSLVDVSGSGSLSEIYPNNGDQDLTVKFTSDPSVFNSGVLLKVVLTNFCPSSVTDATGGIYYSTVRVKDQCWMKENLRAGNLTSGATIGILTDYATGSTTVPYRRYPNGDQSNTSTYSYLYNWPAVANNSSTVSDGMSGLCPSGWHIPTRQDVMTFANNTTASFRTSTSGFNAKMAGRATYTNTTSYYDFGSYAYFWMTYSNSISSFYISSSGAIQSNFTSGEGRAHYKSLRCLKD